MILNSHLLSPLPDLDAMYESLPQKVCEELLRLGHRPSAIEMRSDLLDGLLAELLSDAGITLKWKQHMPDLDGAIISMMKGMG